MIEVIHSFLGSRHGHFWRSFRLLLHPGKSQFAPKQPNACTVQSRTHFSCRICPRPSTLVLNRQLFGNEQTWSQASVLREVDFIQMVFVPFEVALPRVFLISLHANVVYSFIYIHILFYKYIDINTYTYMYLCI